MQTEQILALLVAERDRLSRAIEALQGSAKGRGRLPKAEAPVQAASTQPNRNAHSARLAGAP